MSKSEKIGWIVLLIAVIALFSARKSLPKKIVFPVISEYSESLFRNSEEYLPFNKATVQDLKNISGIGEKTAQAIVLYRIENGYYHSYKELLLVNGVGKDKMKRIQEYYQEKGY